MNWLDKLEKKFGKFYIPNLMLIITVGTALMYFLCLITGDSSFENLFILSPRDVLNGQVWRLITFIFVPSNNSAIFLLISLSFYYWAGSSLERVWGEFKFNVYYFIGIIATIIISFIVGSTATGDFINLSLFLAVAKVYPDMEILFMFILPLKAKHLAYFNWALIFGEAVYYVYQGRYLYVLYALIPVINYLIFLQKVIINKRKCKQVQLSG